MLHVQIFSYVFSKARKVSSKMDLNILVALAAYVSEQTIAAEKNYFFRKNMLQLHVLFNSQLNCISGKQNVLCKFSNK